jgi:hypothetical protein
LASVCAGASEFGLLFWQPSDRALVMPRRLNRLPGFEHACEVSAAAGWPVLLRETGGEPVPQSASTINIALVYAPPRSEGDLNRIETGYRRLCDPICQLLDELGGTSSVGEIDGAFCDGRFNVNLDGRKMVGTAQRWRQSQGGQRPVGLVHGRCCWITSANRWLRRSIASMRLAVWSSECAPKAISLCMKSLRQTRWSVSMTVSTNAGADVQRLAGTEDHHGLAFDVHQVAFFQVLEHAADHLPRTPDNPPDFLTGHFDLHAVGVGHGIGLFAQLQQAAGDTPGDVEERQVADLARGVAQTLCDLSAEHVKNVGILLGQFAEFRVADFGDFAFDLGAHPGAALLFQACLFKQTQLTEKVPGVQVGDDHFAAVVILDQDGDRAFDNEKQGFRAITGTNDIALGLIATALAMHQQFVEVLDLGGRAIATMVVFRKNCTV